jgi:AcrR family transcriptional regulator
LKQHQNKYSRGRYKSGVATRSKIVEAAINLLVEQGYHSFSLRKVAMKAGVSIGNLQHHFRSKENLIAEMLDDVISGYLEEFEKLIHSTDSPRDQLRTVVRRVVEDLKTRETTVFFPELWSLANHEPGVDKLMVSMYGKYQNIYHDIIRRINPELSESQIEKAGLFFAASLEGHTMFVGHNKSATHHNDAIAEIAYNSFLHIIESSAIPE